jgi:hypothetical protein
LPLMSEEEALRKDAARVRSESLGAGAGVIEWLNQYGSHVMGSGSELPGELKLERELELDIDDDAVMAGVPDEVTMV